MGTQPWPITERYWAIVVLRSLGSKSTVDLLPGEYLSQAATSSHFSNRMQLLENT